MTQENHDLLLKFQDSLRTKNRQPSTVESYGRDAQDFLRFLDSHHLSLDSVEPETLIYFRDYLGSQALEAENSVRRKVIGVRQFYRFLVDSRHLGDSPFDAVPLPERNEELKDAVSEKRFESILSSLPCTNLKQARDRSILMLLAYEGVKANELIGLQWRDYLSGPKLATLSVPGQKSRTISLQSETASALTLYTQAFRHWADDQEKVNESEFPWIFVAFKGKESNLVLPRLTRHGLKFMLHELGERHGLKHLHTEGLRHHAIQYLLASGMSPESVMSHLGLRRLGNIGKHLAARRSS